MIRFTVRGVITMPASRYETQVVMRSGWNPHPTFSNRQNNCNMWPPISCPERGYHTLPHCRLRTVLFQFAKLVCLQLLTSVVNSLGTGSQRGRSSFTAELQLTKM